jgi:chloramphenicol O-acetyltransferase type B
MTSPPVPSDVNNGVSMPLPFTGTSPSSAWFRRTKIGDVPPVMLDLASLIRGHKLNRAVELLSSIVSALAVRHRIAYLRRLVQQGQLEVGSHTYGLPEIYVSHPDDKVVLGRYCSIAPGVVMVPGGMHPLNSASTFPFARRWNLEQLDSAVERRGPIVIGDDVWLCSGSMILSGVQVGSGAVVAAGAVVTSNVKPYEIVGGVPTKTIGQRFSDADVDKLLKSRWWEWPEREIRDVIPLLRTGHLDAFLAYVDTRAGAE